MTNIILSCMCLYCVLSVGLVSEDRVYSQRIKWLYKGYEVSFFSGECLTDLEIILAFLGS